MGINVLTSMGFENREFMKNAAKNILQKKGMGSKDAERISNNVVYDFVEDSSGMTVLKASTQVTMSRSLSETLNYLKAHANDKRKKEYILGELWQAMPDINEKYQGELIDLNIDFSEKNIFAA